MCILLPQIYKGTNYMIRINAGPICFGSDLELPSRLIQEKTERWARSLAPDRWPGRLANNSPDWPLANREAWGTALPLPRSMELRLLLRRTFSELELCAGKRARSIDNSSVVGFWFLAPGQTDDESKVHVFSRDDVASETLHVLTLWTTFLGALHEFKKFQRSSCRI